ncbi:MAG: PDZ domain-containing protein [Micromonosporaceae bacterium]|nr:PDZ domain-containing protein [Micromonosporaceae bacterium]
MPYRGSSQSPCQAGPQSGASAVNSSARPASNGFAATPTGASPWWTDALNDPWRDPNAQAAVTVPGRPADPGPPLEPLPEERPSGGGTAPMRVVFLVVFITALLAGGLGGALGYVVAARSGGGVATAPGDVPPLAKRPPKSVAGVVQQVMPSLVTVIIRKGDRGGNGSGFVVSADGYIVTNAHVATGAGDDADITVRFHDGETARAELVAAAPNTDIAVLKVKRDDLAPVTFGDSDGVAVGDPVIAVGAPLGLQDTVTTGVVSALDRAVSGSEDDPADAFAAIQTDAAINPGNSGGALLDGAGRVIGVNTAIATLKRGEDDSGGNIGLGFAIPVNQAKRIATEIIKSGKARETVLGVQVDTGYQDANGGVKLASVDSGGPAGKAGLEKGDVVTRVNKRALYEAIDLVALVRKYAPGTVISLEYRRGGESRKARVTVAGSTE